MTSERLRARATSGLVREPPLVLVDPVEDPAGLAEALVRLSYLSRRPEFYDEAYQNARYT